MSILGAVGGSATRHAWRGRALIVLGFVVALLASTGAVEAATYVQIDEGRIDYSFYYGGATFHGEPESIRWEADGCQESRWHGTFGVYINATAYRGDTLEFRMKSGTPIDRLALNVTEVFACNPVGTNLADPPAQTFTSRLKRTVHPRTVWIFVSPGTESHAMDVVFTVWRCISASC